jgi:hypothetical protein
MRPGPVVSQPRVTVNRPRSAGPDNHWVKGSRKGGADAGARWEERGPRRRGACVWQMHCAFATPGAAGRPAGKGTERWKRLPDDVQQNIAALLHCCLGSFLLHAMRCVAGMRTVLEEDRAGGMYSSLPIGTYYLGT